MKEVVATVDQWIVDMAATAWRLILDVAAWIYEWLVDIYMLVQDGDSSTIPLGEIIVALIVGVLSIALTFRILSGFYRAVGWFVRWIDVSAHKLAGLNNVVPLRRQTVRLEGRWNIHGYEGPSKSEHRRRAWRKKLMTPKQQQRYVDRVEKESVREKAKRRL